MKECKINAECSMVMYHYVRNMHETQYPKIQGLLLHKFISQLNYIEKNYKVISMEQYSDFLQSGKEIPENSCILTFDDGLMDHYTNVFPVLKKRGISGVFFPITQTLTDFVVPSAHKNHFLLVTQGTKTVAGEFNRILKAEYPELVEQFVVHDRFKKEERYRWDDNLTANLKSSIASMHLTPKVDILNRIFSVYFPDEKEFCKELFLGWNELKEMEEAGMHIGSHTHTLTRFCLQ